jgi:catechol 2,3-dioxygenase-like lactoylglutathione lyase family enzyme
MFTRLDHLIVAVKDLENAEENYKKLFGIAPVWRGKHKDLGTSNSLFNFENIYLELLSSSGNGVGADLVDQYLLDSGEGLMGMVFATENLNAVRHSLKEEGFLLGDPVSGQGINTSDQQIRKWKNLFLPFELTRGIFSFVIEHTDGNLPQSQKLNDSSPHKLDHVVINTNDADGFIKIYKEIYGIRLALDKVIDAWNKRMLFFRLNKTTIEVIEEKGASPSVDKLWGLAWSVKNLNQTHARLKKAGVDISEIKPGIKENTKVATVKSHTHNVPTLLIEHIS